MSLVLDCHRFKLRVAFRQFLEHAFDFHRALLQQYEPVTVLYGAEAMRDEDDGFFGAPVRRWRPSRLVR